MKRALLLFPPQHCLEETLRIWTFSYGANFPLALLRQSTWLKSQGWEVDVLDAFNVHPNTPASLAEVLGPGRVVREAPCGNFEAERRTKPVRHVGLSWEALEARLAALRAPDEVWISSIFTWSWQTTHRAVEVVRKVFPSARVKLGGVYPTLCPGHAATTGAEVVEGCQPEVDAAWLDADVLAAVPGLDGVVLKTSVGCPNRCSYCAVHVLEGRRFAFRDPSDVLDELDALHARVRIPRVFFWESNLLLKADRHLVPLLEGVLARGVPYPIQAPEGFQPSLLTPRLARLMRQTGFREMRLTQETTDPARLAESKRPTGLAHVERAIANLLDAGFAASDVSIVLLIGQPGQTLDQVLRDLVQVYRLGVKATFLVYSPIPRTADFDTFGALFAGRPLEDLDSFLYPMASPDLTVAQMDTVIRYFNDRYLPVERIVASRTEDLIVRRMQALVRDVAG